MACAESLMAERSSGCVSSCAQARRLRAVAESGPWNAVVRAARPRWAAPFPGRLAQGPAQATVALSWSDARRSAVLALSSVLSGPLGPGGNLLSGPVWICGVLFGPQRGTELARSIRCFIPEDINGKALVLNPAPAPAPAPDIDMNIGMSLVGLPLVGQKLCPRSGQMKAVVMTCTLCRQDLQDLDAQLLPCQHLLCKNCFQGLSQKLQHGAKAHGTAPNDLVFLVSDCVVLTLLSFHPPEFIACPGCNQVYLTRDVTEHFFLKCLSTGQSKMTRKAVEVKAIRIHSNLDVGLLIQTDPNEDIVNNSRTLCFQNCSECKEKRAAHILCTYCNRWLCSSCTEEHRHGPAPGGPLFPRAQKGSPGVNGGSGDFALYCPLHTQEVLKLFCETCDVLTCHSCLMVEHKEHRCRHLEEVLQNQRMLLESVTTQVAHKKSSLQTSAKQIEDRIFEVKHQHRKVENQIKMAKMVLMNELNKQANGLIEELEGITNERKRKLEQQLQSIMVLNRQFEHVQNFINWAVCSKTSIPFLFSKELIVFQMQRLLETNCNTDPGSPWSIRFTWEPNFWTKQLASLGESGPTYPVGFYLIAKNKYRASA
ncbi:Tripartite motif-containing protein 66 [Galemys pyrenaicus]|uniref:Tripartite motif-containing protein 66 n=1 Tax=Galemys pyrenaicus TaxID=202257 RepID=A0A8J5ZVJ6_GALPY|nr:Tripartite motif-containing protein 66 [Galemys pyrenaicus]